MPVSNMASHSDGVVSARLKVQILSAAVRAVLKVRVKVPICAFFIELHSVAITPLPIEAKSFSI